MNPEYLNSQELQLLLNHLGEHFTIKSPLHNTTLYTVKRTDTTYQLSQHTDSQKLNEIASNYQSQQKEIPTTNDLLQALLASGMLTYTNLEAFTQTLQNYHKSLKIKKLFFCTDTNTIYHRFITTYQHHNNLLDSRQLILIDTIKSEIEAHLNYKYSTKDIQQLKTHAPPHMKSYLDSQLNKRKKHARTAAYLARPEYSTLQSQAHSILHGKRASSNDKEDNDKIIIETLADYEKHNPNVLILFLTADSSIVDICRSQGIEAFHFTMPTLPHSTQIQTTPWHLGNGLFLLTKIFGIIKTDSITLIGDFSSKEADPNTTIKIEFSNQDMQESIHRDLRICRKLLNQHLPNTL